MNPVIFALEDKQLITRAEDPDNRRILRVSLTASGRRLLEACDERIDALESRLLLPLSKNRLAQLRSTLSELLEHARSDAEAIDGATAPYARTAPASRNGGQPRRALKRVARR